MGSGTYAGGGGSSLFVDGSSDLGLCLDGVCLDWHDDVGFGGFSNRGGHYEILILYSSCRVSVEDWVRPPSEDLTIYIYT